MTQPLKCMEARENMDRISGLHNDILVYLLSFLPTLCAVRTRILSSRWRGLHNLTSRLQFDATTVNLSLNEFQANREKFSRFVNTVLKFHKVSPIKTFHLNCGWYFYDRSQLHAWISAALSKKVEQFELFLYVGFSDLPRGLFNSTTLVELKLCAGMTDLLRVPESVHLPRVKRLHLTRLAFPDEASYIRLLSACPLLQDLQMYYCVYPSGGYFRVASAVLRAHASKLVRMVYILSSSVRSRDLSTLMSLRNTHIFDTARLEFSNVKHPKSIRIALGFIKTLNHVKEIYLQNNTLEHLCASKDDDFPSFPNLEKLELGHCSYEAWKYIPFLLANSPKLDTLIFRGGVLMSKSREEKWPTDITLFPFTTPVKTIKIFHYHHSATELTLMEYILENAGLMKKMVGYGGLMTSMQLLEAKEALMKPSTKSVVEINNYIC